MGRNFVMAKDYRITAFLRSQQSISTYLLKEVEIKLHSYL